MPEINPVTTIGLEPELEPTIKPGYEVAVHRVTVKPPLLVFGINATETEDVLTTVGEPMLGRRGTLRGVTELEADEAGLVPIPFVQVTEKV